MISALTAIATGAAVKLFTEGVMLGIAIFTAHKTNGKGSKEGRDCPKRK